MFQSLRKALLSLDRKLFSRQELLSRIQRVEGMLQDLVRRELTRGIEPATPLDNLRLARGTLSSQNGEDGLVLELIRRIGNPTHRFVEVCCGDNGGNSGVLAFELGWSGLMVDGDDKRLVDLRKRFHVDDSRVHVVHAWVTRENIVEMIVDAAMATEIDLLSLDLDGNDYWIWEAIDNCNPRIVIVEYNSAFGPDRKVTIPYQADFRRPKHFKNYYGCSLGALEHLGQTKGYRLIGVEPRGVNAFFLREDVLTEDLPALSTAECYKMLDKHVHALVKAKFDDYLTEIRRLGLPLIEVDPD